MSKKSKISNKQVDTICERVGEQLKQSGNGSAGQTTVVTTQSNKGLFFWGAASGVAFMLAAPLLRPAARSAVKAGIRIGRQAQEFGSSLKEEFEDITAEAQAELNRERPSEDHPQS
jgi:hypothetical protein